jgi:putative transcriptional regulator
VRLEWDPQKERQNVAKHGVSFGEAKTLFTSKVDFVEIYDAEHSDVEDRFIAIGPILSGSRPGRLHGAERAMGDLAGTSALHRAHGEAQMKKRSRELTPADFARSLRRSQRERIMRGQLEPGDVAALRRFIGLTQAKFAQALGISVHTLRNWEQDRRTPEGPALALLRIAARHPRVVRENVRSAA